MAQPPGSLAATPLGRGWLGAAVVGAAAALVLQIVAIRAQSLTSDEPHHIAAGHQALRWGTNSLNLEHPPLVKLVAAVPLLFEREALAPSSGLAQWRALALEAFDPPERTVLRQTLTRTMMFLMFVLPFLAATFALGHAVGGARTGALLALFLALSFGVLPFLSLVTTDTAVALGFLAVLLAGRRYLQAPSWRNTIWIGLGLGIAIATKHSGLLAALPALLAIGLALPSLSWRRIPRALGHAALVLIVSSGVLALTYAAANRRYDRSLGRESIGGYSANQGTLLVEDELRPWRERLLSLETVSPGAAQWLTGVLGIRAQNTIGVYQSYAFGRIDRRGRWWFFPAVFALKTPLSLLAALAAAAAAAIVGARRGTPRARDRFVVLLAATAASYLAVALTSNYNLGMRHLLPILPILYLPAAMWAARRNWRAGAVGAALLAEAAILAPNWIAATNTWWLGERNPTRFALARDDFDWNQGFIALGREARRRGIKRLFVVDPLVTREELAAYVPNAVWVGPGSPRLRPGWYAVAIVLDQYLPAILNAQPGSLYNREGLVAQARRWEEIWTPLREEGRPADLAAGTFRLVRLGRRANPAAPETR